jgi:hypothetical protein
VSIREQVTGKRLPDICGWCGKNLKPQRDVAWREMKSPEGIAAAANYCPMNKAEKLDPERKRSKCHDLGQQEPEKVIGRLRKFLSKLKENEALGLKYGLLA